MSGGRGKHEVRLSMGLRDYLRIAGDRSDALTLSREGMSLRSRNIRLTDRSTDVIQTLLCQMF